VTKTRLEAFSDGVIAILITIMVLELRPPAEPTLAGLRSIAGHLFVYVLSFITLGIYWNNHHHMLHTTTRVNGAILWANLHLLFWLSLVPFVTEWMGPDLRAPLPTAVYAVVLLLAAVAYRLLQTRIIRLNGHASTLATAVGRDGKGKLSATLYLASVPLAFVSPWISDTIFAVVAAIWLLPDRRIETIIGHEDEPRSAVQRSR
jgi:TMEM175 potassium channel family protein